MNAGLTAGAMVHLIPKPETGLILDAVKRKTPTLVIAVPPLFERIADEVIRPGPEELRANPRSAPAKLRWAVRS